MTPWLTRISTIAVAVPITFYVIHSDVLFGLLVAGATAGTLAEYGALAAGVLRATDKASDGAFSRPRACRRAPAACYRVNTSAAAPRSAAGHRARAERRGSCARTADAGCAARARPHTESHFGIPPAQPMRVCAMRVCVRGHCGAGLAVALAAVTVAAHGVYCVSCGARGRPGCSAPACVVGGSARACRDRDSSSHRGGGDVPGTIRSCVCCGVGSLHLFVWAVHVLILLCPVDL